MASAEDGGPSPTPTGAEVRDNEPPTGALMDRRVMVRLTIIVLVVIVVVLALFNRLSPIVMRPLLRAAEKLQDDKWSPRSVVTVLLLCLIFNSVPIPGRTIWAVVVGLVYGYAGFPFVCFGHIFGSLMAFTFARYSCGKRSGSTPMRGVGPMVWMLEFMRESVKVVEYKPWRMVFLLGLSPIWPCAVAYVLGSQAKSLQWWKFSVPFAFSSVKLLGSLFLASNLKSATEARAQHGRLRAVFNICLPIVTQLLLMLGGRMALRELRKARQQEQSQTTASSSNEATAEVVGADVP